jgi:hypothetical protein
MYILIVEDDTRKYGEIREVITSVTDDSSEIDLAVCASEAVVKLSKRRYDLLLLGSGPIKVLAGRWIC